MTRRTNMPSRRTLAAYLEGEVTRSEATEIEAALRDPAADRELQGLAEIRTRMARLPEPLDSADLVAGVRAAIAAAPVAPPRRWRSPRWVWAAATIAAVAAVLTVVLFVRPGGEDPAGIDLARSKSATPANVEDRWVGIDAFRVGSSGVALPAAAGIRASDALVFRYTNGGRAPFEYLMVFAVDAANQVHWYYPAYELAGDDPASVPIQPGARGAALPDAVHHDLAPGALVVYGVFTRAPLHVSEVERAVAALVASGDFILDAPPRLPFAGAGQHVLRARVSGEPR